MFQAIADWAELSTNFIRTHIQKGFTEDQILMIMYSTPELLKVVIKEIKKEQGDSHATR